jgi:hypothetical protein
MVRGHHHGNKMYPICLSSGLLSLVFGKNYKQVFLYLHISHKSEKSPYLSKHGIISAHLGQG